MSDDARPRWLRPGWLVLAALLLLVAAGVVMRRSGGPGALHLGGSADSAAGRALPPASDSSANAPRGVRVRVQVVNATRTRGLARRATRYLRDRGFDVVEVGTTTPVRDGTLVLDRSGHPDWASRVARAMGGAPVSPRPDSSRYLDVTVLVGRDWRPPAESLDP